MQLRSMLAIAGLTLIATACGSDSKGTTDPGESPGQANFSATISGGMTKSLSGQAAFAHDNAQAEVGFAMGFGNASASEAIILWRPNAGVLGVGQHTVADYTSLEEADVPANQIAGIVIMQGPGNVPMVCASVGGTVTVTSSASNRLRGSFNFTALCANLQTEEEVQVTVSGNFDAAGGNVAIPG